MMSELPLASARLSKLRILCLNDLLDGDLCKKFLLFPYFFCLFFWISNIVLSDALIVPVLQLQTQIRSHIEYLIQTYYILLLILLSKLLRNLALMRFNDDT